MPVTRRHVRSSANEKGRPEGDPFTTSRSAQGRDQPLTMSFSALAMANFTCLVGGLGHRLAGGGVADLTLGAGAAGDLAQARQGDGAASGDFFRHDGRDGVQRCAGGLLVAAHRIGNGGHELGLGHRFVGHGSIPCVVASCHSGSSLRCRRLSRCSGPPSKHLLSALKSSPRTTVIRAFWRVFAGSEEGSLFKTAQFAAVDAFQRHLAQAFHRADADLQGGG